MPELSALRARLKDRQVKDGALGTAEASICLDLALVDQLAELEAERDRIIASYPRGDSASLAGAAAPEPDTSEIDARIEAKKAEVRAVSLTLVFRAVSSVRYQEILNQFDDPEEERVAFMDALAGACLHEVWSDGERVEGFTWDEFRESISFGEWDQIATLAYALNRRKVDAPFSSRPSRTTPN